MVLWWFDPDAAKYDDPLLIQSKYGDILTPSVRFPDAGVNRFTVKKVTLAQKKAD
jgi:hypothetical protein